MQTSDFVLCNDCIQKMEENGLVDLSIDQMIETEAELPATLAIELANEEEGIYFKRKGDEHPFTVRTVDVDGSGNLSREFCIVNEQKKTIGYKTFTTEELLAQDYIIVE